MYTDDAQQLSAFNNRRVRHMTFKEPVVEFVSIDLDSVVATSGQDGSHCTNDAYSSLTCDNAAPRLCT